MILYTLVTPTLSVWQTNVDLGVTDAAGGGFVPEKLVTDALVLGCWVIPGGDHEGGSKVKGVWKDVTGVNERVAAGLCELPKSHTISQ